MISLCQMQAFNHTSQTTYRIWRLERFPNVSGMDPVNELKSSSLQRTCQLRLPSSTCRGTKSKGPSASQSSKLILNKYKGVWTIAAQTFVDFHLDEIMNSHSHGHLQVTRMAFSEYLFLPSTSTYSPDCELVLKLWCFLFVVTSSASWFNNGLGDWKSSSPRR